MTSTLSVGTQPAAAAFQAGQKLRDADQISTNNDRPERLHEEPDLANFGLSGSEQDPTLQSSLTTTPRIKIAQSPGQTGPEPCRPLSAPPSIRATAIDAAARKARPSVSAASAYRRPPVVLFIGASTTKEHHGRSLAPGTRIGHVHLKVADLERAIGFYRGVLGFELTSEVRRRRRRSCRRAAITTTSASTPGRAGRHAAAAGTTGLYHAASSTRRGPLADALRRLGRRGSRSTGDRPRRQRGAYLRDPDGNGVELYRDRPPETGRATPTAGWRCSPGGSTSATCSRRPEASHGAGRILILAETPPRRDARACHRPDAARLDRAPPRGGGRDRRLCLAPRRRQPKDVEHEQTLDGLPEGVEGHTHRAEAERGPHGSARLRRVVRLVPGGPKVEVDAAGARPLRLRRVGDGCGSTPRGPRRSSGRRWSRCTRPGRSASRIGAGLGTRSTPASMPLALNPLGKIPLPRAGGRAGALDSRVICRYLDELAGGRLYPGKPRLWETLTLEATADGITEATLAIVYEARLRPEARRVRRWVAGQWAKVAHALDAVEGRWMAYLAGPLDMRPDRARLRARLPRPAAAATGLAARRRRSSRPG